MLKELSNSLLPYASWNIKAISPEIHRHRHRRRELLQNHTFHEKTDLIAFKTNVDVYKAPTLMPGFGKHRVPFSFVGNAFVSSTLFNVEICFGTRWGLWDCTVNMMYSMRNAMDL